MAKRLLILGGLMLIPYGYALTLVDLRKHTPQFLVAFFAAFVLYAIASGQALQAGPISKRGLAAIFTVSAILQGSLLFTRPTLSDDMYRYVWDGRVQAQGISPYRYPPDAPELASLRDREIWPSINRKQVVTVYPPAAEMAFAALWRVWPDSVRGLQLSMALGGLVAGGLLVGLMHDLGRSPARVLILLWSPLLTFELAHSAHLDGLVLPLLVGAWWARARERDRLSGTLLGLAAAIKLYPVLLLPALWRSTLPRQRKYRMPLAFAITVAVCYLPYLLSSGAGVIGFLPDYFQQQFNIAPLVQGLLALPQSLGFDPKQGLSLIFSGSLLLIGGWMVLRPANNAQDAIRRSLWMIGAFTLLSQNLFSWYMLWLLPLLAIFMEPGRLRLAGLSLPRFNAWTGWWLFCGLVGLSYSFFIRWKPVPAALWAQFLPLYLFLLAGGIRSLSTSMKSGYPLKKTFMSFIHSIDRRSPMFGKLRLDVVDSNREASDSD